MNIDHAAPEFATFAPLSERVTRRGRCKETPAVFTLSARSDGWHGYTVSGHGWTEAGSFKTLGECEDRISDVLAYRRLQITVNPGGDKGAIR